VSFDVSRMMQEYWVDLGKILSEMAQAESNMVLRASRSGAALSIETIAQLECPQCGYVDPAHSKLPPDPLLRPWHIIHGRLGVKAYVSSLGQEAHEWLLALYVDAELQLLAVDTVARGDVGGVEIPKWKILERGHALKAAGFVLVHNHPSGDPRPSESDIKVTRNLSWVAADLNMPLLDHLIIAGDQMMSCSDF
jgi:hypothetical protein